MQAFSTCKPDIQTEKLTSNNQLIVSEQQCSSEYVYKPIKYRIVQQLQIIKKASIQTQCRVMRIVFRCCFQSSHDRDGFLRQWATLSHMQFNRHFFLPRHKVLGIQQFIAACTKSNKYQTTLLRPYLRPQFVHVHVHIGQYSFAIAVYPVPTVPLCHMLGQSL